MKILGWLLFFLGLLVGIVLSALSVLEVSASLDLGDALQVVVVILIFLAANQIYQKLHDQRTKRVELLLDLAGDVITDVDRAHSAFVECGTGTEISPISRFKLDGALSGYSNAVHTLEEALTQCGMDLGGCKFEELKRDREEYKDSLTRSPYPSRYSADFVPMEARMYDQIRRRLRLFQLRLSQDLD